MAKNSIIVPNDSVFKYYFYFIQERMNIFWRKCHGDDTLTEDAIFKEYKFTNVYRACDRVSQYLIHDVIYKDLKKYTPEDVLLRILIFKVFNRIETWEYLQRIQDITVQTFDVDSICFALTSRQKKHPIFSNAYMMAGRHANSVDISCKHEVWLRMIEDELIRKERLQQILNATSLEDVYKILRNLPLIGDFLAYQYAIDFDYSPYLNFDENSFVKAGVGAIRGIKKCFLSYGDSFEDAIVFTQAHFEYLQEKYGYTDFHPLPGHDLTLIDLQNCFCETDKYLRVKMPELLVGNKRIKQRYRPSPERIYYFFPPKWHVGEINISEGCCLSESILH